MTSRSTRHRIKIDLTRDPIKIDLRPGAGGDAANAEGWGRSAHRRTDRNRRGAGPFKDPRRGIVRLQWGARAAARGSLIFLNSHYFHYIAFTLFSSSPVRMVCMLRTHLEHLR